MFDLTLRELLTVIKDLGTLGVIVIALWGFVKERPWWYSAREYKQVVKDRDEWKYLALQNTGLIEKAVEFAEAERHRRRSDP